MTGSSHFPITHRRLAALSVLALVAALLVAPSASAARRVTIDGGGWGHGIGMSQYGAYGRARQGKTASEILEHYYSGARVQAISLPSDVRVGLLQYKSSISVTSSAYTDGGGKVEFKVEGEPGTIAHGGSASSWKVEVSNAGGVRLYKNGNEVVSDGRRVFGDDQHPLIMFYESFGTLVRIAEKSNSYAYGRMEFGTFATPRCDGTSCLRLVVDLPMQRYLYGLGEVPSSWPGAALRSQAIAGRTYAYDKSQRSGDHRLPCDCTVYDSTLDQAYIGDAKRTGSGEYWDDWVAAVDDTNDQVILYKGDPVQALYSSSSGGYTENNENVWGGTPLPYLRGVPDKADAVSANPNHTWSVEMTWRSFGDKLDAAFKVGRLQRFKLMKPFGVSGRVTVVKSPDKGGARIVGSDQTVRVSGWSLRSALGLKDTLFRVDISYSVSQKFANRYNRLDGSPGTARSASYAVPRNSESSLGRAQDFAVGRMEWSRASDQVSWLWGKVLNHYDSLGREKSTLGMPASSLWGPGSFYGARFDNGQILWTKAGGAHAVVGLWSEAFKALGGPRGHLGAPMADVESTGSLPGKGKRQRFATGLLYRNPSTKQVFGLWGSVADRYLKIGEGTSDCGYPTASQTEDADGTRATFEHGMIVLKPSGDVSVECG
jgi:SpoIID/LytB domain protein